MKFGKVNLKHGDSVILTVCDCGEVRGVISEITPEHIEIKHTKPLSTIYPKSHWIRRKKYDFAIEDIFDITITHIVNGRKVKKTIRMEA